MNNLLIYIAQVTFVFSLLFITYRTVLSRLTFHTLNRLLLLSLIPISFLFPFINDLFPSMPQGVIDIPLYDGIAFNSIVNFNTTEAITANLTINYWSILTVLYCLGVSFSLAKLFFSLRKLVLTKQKSKIHQEEGYKIIITNISQIFSFFNWIFIPKEKQGDYDNAIIEHEKAHIKLKHSVDIIITEVYITIFWFNPFVYFYRKSLKSVHEFQADKRVLNKQIKALHYLQLLLQNLEINRPNNIYNYFNYPILKRRIDMITKVKSTQLAKLLYLILLPVCVLFLFAFAKPNAESIPLTSTTNVFKISNSPPSLFPLKGKSKDDITSFFGVKRKHPKSKNRTIHGGIDIRAKIGTPVIATADGTIYKASLEGDWGNLIIISHADGYETWYAHLNGFSIIESQTVKKGEVIGYVGNTGISTGPHLHYEVKHNGKRVNPIDYLTE